MTPSVDTLMALHRAATSAAVQYADCARVSLRSERTMQAYDDMDEANEALRTALTEALQAAQTNIQNYPEQDNSAQPVRSLNELERLDIVTNWFSDEADITRAMQMLTDFEQTTPIAQPAREPLTDDQIQEIYIREYNKGHHGREFENAFARGIERAHHIGGDK